MKGGGAGDDEEEQEDEEKEVEEGMKDLALSSKPLVYVLFSSHFFPFPLL